MRVEQCRQPQQHAGGQFDLITQSALRGRRLDHPPRDLQRPAVGLSHAQRQGI